MAAQSAPSPSKVPRGRGQRTISVLDLFSGAGGLTTGLHQASHRYRTVCAVELDHTAVASYRENHGDVVHVGTIQGWLQQCVVPEVDLTRAGGADGISLAGLVGDVKTRLSARRERFLEHLVGLGWRDDDEDLYHDRYLLRSRPLAYLVDQDFPALTQIRLASAVPHPDLVSAVSYRVDVSDRMPGEPGGPLDAFLAYPEGAHE
jgi:hypothetical protein